MYGVIGSFLRSSSKRWTLTTTYGQARCRGKIRVAIISVIQSNQNTKDMIRNNIIQKFLKWNMKDDLPFIVTELTKKQYPKRQKTGSPRLQGSQSK
ncbi:hypothetical protein CEXT_235281 [Caerostris extrusa]|uniref:Uncharacterized protein n=1 Tax=Caerostris extrusa TaxID=172846 RepID=A0AAV4Y6H7_CAEEX|nr:hypothetical protein CEXT_235281 [Caerostris extrusa]